MLKECARPWELNLQSFECRWRQATNCANQTRLYIYNCILQLETVVLYKNKQTKKHEHLKNLNILVFLSLSGKNYDEATLAQMREMEKDVSLCYRVMHRAVTYFVTCIWLILSSPEPKAHR